MIKFDNPLLLVILGQLITGAGTYAAIRADLREAIVNAAHAEVSASLANSRIDRVLEAFHKDGKP